jgi:hypothetical protein
MRNDDGARKSNLRYESLLLRIWCRSEPDLPDWSFRIEHIQDGTALRFSDPEALIAYLWTIIGSQAVLRLAGTEQHAQGAQHGTGADVAGDDA